MAYHHWPTTPPAVVGPPLAPPGAIVQTDGAPRPPSADEVRTIFITGLPGDVKERELHNLLRWLPGFEAAQINARGEQPLGFALFSTPAQAMTAKEALQDLVFDPDRKSALHVEMAKKNLYVKRGVGTDTNSLDQSKRLRTVGDYTHATRTVDDYNHAAYPSFHPPPQPVSLWGTPGYIGAPAPYNPYAGYSVPAVAMPTPNPMAAPGTYTHTHAPTHVQNIKDNPPCNTLFIGNLAEAVLEEEIKGIFCGLPGYKQMKILRQERSTLCFVEFEDVNSAVNVHQSMQGTVIPSSDRGGIRIQFSKNPLGRRKE